MPKNIVYVRNKNGQYAEGYRKDRIAVVTVLLVAFSITSVLYTLHVKNARGASQGSIEATENTENSVTSTPDTVKTDAPEIIDPCDGNTFDGYCDLTSPEIKDMIYRMALKGKLIKWYAAPDIEKEALANKYLKVYPHAGKDVLFKIVSIAYDEHYTDLDYLFSLINCESKFNPKNVNGKNNVPKTSIDRGLWQFNSHWQGKVSDECAFDVECSTKTAVSMLKKGQGSLWVCSSIVKK